VDDAMSDGIAGTVLLLDLDDFADVNDTLGHSSGDELLRVTSRRLVDAAGDALVARLGGDEFAVLLTRISGEAARPYAERLLHVVNEPVPLGGAEIVTTATVGIADFAAESCSAEELLGRADVALSAAKSGRTGVGLYHPEDGNKSARRLALAADLPVAMREGHLSLWYQPQARTESGEITGFEALLRWDHPRFGMVPPPEVVAVAERTGLMPELTAHLVERALEDRRRWWLAGHDLDVAVNVTARDLLVDGLAERVRGMLDRTGTPAGALVLELTESAALEDRDQAARTLASLAAQGVRLSVDDFGTGYSSLSYLDQLPVHEVKIDRSFVLRLERSDEPTIVRATIALAHELGLRVVAEGVENDLARGIVTRLGCDLYQGYGLSRPLPDSEVVRWLDRRAGVLSGEPDTWALSESTTLQK
jgi:diguanylate cyclase (GGDEF)-like protein